MTAAESLDGHPRVLALLERFRAVDATMRDLPVYNDKIAIDGIGFRKFDQDTLLGVVLTPWFMNLVLLAFVTEPMCLAQIGRSAIVALPAGERTFVIGGDEVVGLYRAYSLHSPVLNFTLPGQALAEARRSLALLTTPPAPPQAAASPNAASPAVDRRALLFGRRQAARQQATPARDRL